MQQMEGPLFTYHSEKRLVAFKSGNSHCFVIFIGGLTDGLLSLAYLSPLKERLSSYNWTLIQVVLSSSYLGYGSQSLLNDVDDLDHLVHHLKSPEFHASRILLLGHSTGAQDAVMYMKCGKYKEYVDGIVLQGAVSDRQYFSTLPGYSSHLETAVKMIESGKSQEFMPRDTDIAPITAYRFHSLAGKLTDDDMFSTDLTAEELASKLAHVQVPVLIVYSMKDEYVPPTISKEERLEHLKRMCSVMKNSELCVLEDADHAISDEKSRSEFIERVSTFLHHFD